MMCRWTSVLAITALGASALASAAPDMASFAGVWWAQAPVSRLQPVDGGAVPLTAEAATRYRDTVAGLKSGAVVDQAEFACVPQGMPRAMTSPYPFQIIAGGGMLVFAYEQNRAYRIVPFADHHQDPRIWDPSYMGDGIARWDDNDLVIDSNNFKSDAIFIDASGLPASDRLHLVEHLRLLDGGKRLQDLITVDDPGSFTKPWTARLVFARRDDVHVQYGWICGEPHRSLAAAAHAPVKRSVERPQPLTAAQQAFTGYWKSGRAPDQRPPAAAPPPGAPPPPGNPPPTAPPPPAAQPTGPDYALSLLTPAAAARYQADATAMAAGKLLYDPHAQCLPTQIPGDTVGGVYGSAVIVEPAQVTFLYEESRAMRFVYIDQAHPAHLSPSWTGDSVGHWDGDTLVVDTIGFNGQNVMPLGTNHAPMSAQAHVVERFTLSPAGVLEDQATFEDPQVFTKPFTLPTFFRKSEPFQEYVCQENNLEGGYPTSTGKPKAQVFGPKRLEPPTQ